MYYALIKCDEETGLCEGVHVDMEEVFFFEEFRQDDLTSVQQRTTQWAEKVRDCMGEVLQAERDDVRKEDNTELTAVDNTLPGYV